jgi:hypothetical protein
MPGFFDDFKNMAVGSHPANWFDLATIPGEVITPSVIVADGFALDLNMFGSVQVQHVIARENFDYDFEPVTLIVKLPAANTAIRLSSGSVEIIGQITNKKLLEVTVTDSYVSFASGTFNEVVFTNDIPAVGNIEVSVIGILGSRTLRIITNGVTRDTAINDSWATPEVLAAALHDGIKLTMASLDAP